MVNLILGILTGIAGTCLFFLGTAQSWYVWLLFGSGAVFIVFSFDVLIGSIKEYQPRAAILGFGMFVIPGIVMMTAAWILGF